MNRYTVYLNRPAPDNKVVVYADRYLIQSQLDGSSLLMMESDGGEGSVFSNWDAVVPDEPTQEDSAPGPSQAWWEKGHFHADPQMSVGAADEEPDYDGTDDQVRYEDTISQLFGEPEPVVGGSHDGTNWVSGRGTVYRSYIDHGPYVEDQVRLIDGSTFPFYRYEAMHRGRALDILADRFPKEVGEKLQYPSRCIGGELSGAEGWNVLPDGYRAAFITYQDERVRVFVPEEFTDSDILKEILRLGLGV